MAATPPALSLCMIVRNEEEMLPGCLESASGVVDEIVVVDTGSADGTPGIVQNLAKVCSARATNRSAAGTLRKVSLLRLLWQDDFSAARNVSIEAATGQ